MSNTTFRAGKSRLIYCDDSLPGLTRRKAGRGWANETCAREAFLVDVWP